jgi:molybdopterin converting factor small subunit
MIVYVETHGWLPGASESSVRLEDVHTVADVWARLGTLQADLRPATGTVALVNDRLASWQSGLQDGDVVRFVAAPGGG